MATTANPAVYLSEKHSTSPSIPWYIWTGAIAVTSTTIGGVWDVSWHRSIGRDSFWTPAHMLIYLGGVLAGIVGLWLIYECSSTRNAQLRAASVSVFGLRAPFGVFLAGWGGLAMLTSAPFDNWWHNAYGLDIKIVSPPHTVLILGIRAVAFGMIFLILSAMNRAGAPGLDSQTWVDGTETPLYRHLQILFLYIAGDAIGGQMFFVQEYTWDIVLHQASAYIAVGIAVPIFLAAFAQAARLRWAATALASVYTISTILQILILPLFHAEPKLGPVYFPVTYFVPGKFPVLILVAAFAMDLLWQRTRAWKPWQIALASGFLFIAVLVAVEWPFAKFLLSHASQNRFFGTGYFDYNSRPYGPDRTRVFLNPDHGATLYLGLLSAAIYASISTWIGLAFGRWMKGLQR
jgi:hypothetical protein